MLTVMAANTSAFDMYTRLGYTLDSSSPGVVEPAEQCGYEILSKVRSGLLRTEGHFNEHGFVALLGDALLDWRILCLGQVPNGLTGNL